MAVMCCVHLWNVGCRKALGWKCMLFGLKLRKTWYTDLGLTLPVRSDVRTVFESILMQMLSCARLMFLRVLLSVCRALSLHTLLTGLLLVTVTLMWGCPWVPGWCGVCRTMSTLILGLLRLTGYLSFACVFVYE